jgi:hypothetical protein
MERLIVTMQPLPHETRVLAMSGKDEVIGAMKPLDRFDWASPRAIDRALYERLLSLDFMKVGHNVIFRGPSGVGETTLARNLGQRALEKGKSVRLSTVNEATTSQLLQGSVPLRPEGAERKGRPLPSKGACASRDGLAPSGPSG